MNTTQRTLSLLTLSAAALVLAACDQSAPPTVGEKVDTGIERSQQAGSEVKKDASEMGTAIADGAADMTITTKVKAALAGDDQLSALSIEVDTTNKVVTLTGPAPTQAAFDRASSLAQAVDGVTDVKNQLTVAGKS